MKLPLLFLFLTTFTLKGSSLTDTTDLQKKRLIPMIVSTNLVYSAGLIYVSKIWYSKNDRTSFHFFNDFPEWKQLDKAGHGLTSFHESVIISAAYRWAGIDYKKSAVVGSLAGFLYQLPIEILDGYGKSYGASVPDLVANLSGSALFLGQKLAWKELRIVPKISFHPTKYSALRPSVLGNNLREQMLKDYNGQTYWLSFNLSSFFRQTEQIPKFINLSVGYGAED